MQNVKAPVSIAIDFSSGSAHLFKISMTIANAFAEQKLSLPVWTPGSYMVREFAQHIVKITAYDEKNELGVRKIDKNSFVIASQASTIININYEVYGFDSSIRAAFIDNNQAFFNGCALFLRPLGFEQSPFLLKLIKPEGLFWHVATGMPSVLVDDRGFGSYIADNYDELIDYPFQVSEMMRLKFSAASVPHEIVLASDVRPFNEARLTRDLAALCESHIEMFGKNAPFFSYTFLVRLEEGSYGGLEHRNSSMLLSSPLVLPKDDGEPDAHYRTFLGLCSHEYFHAWNIKRLKPKSFIPLDYDRECYTTMLWIFEGITSYYDDLALVRSGIISRESYFEMMGKNYTKLLRNKGRFKQSLALASFDAWIKFYRQNENSNNATTSYYLKGSFNALYLDLLIRHKNDNGVSLDDVMVKAFERYQEVGLTEDNFFALLEEIGRLNGLEVKNKFIYGTDDVELARELLHFGINLLIKEDEYLLSDKTKACAYFGFKYRIDDHGRVMLFEVDDEGPAMQAGLSPQDEIIAINNIRLDNSNVADFLASIRKEEVVTLHYARKKLVKSCQLLTQTLPKTYSRMELVPSITKEEQRRLDQWLGVSKPI